MERLTERHAGVAVIKDKSQQKDAMEVLARYEETGLIPEEIMDGKMLTGWIPVKERLPEVGIYLVTCDDEKYPVKVMRFKESGDTLLWYTSRGIYDGRIYAWMPLPEPYAEQTKE